MGDFIPSGSGESASPIHLRDSSRGSEGQKGELGRFASVVVGIVVQTDEGGFVIKTRDGHLQPRNWHESEGEAISSDFPSLKDRRYSVALIADHQNGFGDVIYPTDDANPFKNDWPFAQKSTRIVDGSDPKGKSALLAQLCRVIDDLNDQYTAAIPFKRLSGSDKDPNHDQVATGYLYDADQKVGGLLDRVFTINPSDEEGKGRDGTVIAAASIRHDAIFTHVAEGSGNSDDDSHGPLDFDTSDASALAAGSTISGATEYQGSLKWDSVKRKWVFTYFAPSSGGGGGAGGGGGYYGDGVDGAITIGTSIVTSPFMNGGTIIDAATPAGGNYFDTSVTGPGGNGNTIVAIAFLRRDLYATTLSIPATVTIGGITYPLVFCPGPYKIRASVSVTVDGRISNSGWAWTVHPDLVGLTNCRGDTSHSGGGGPGNGAALYPQYQAVTDGGAGGGGTGTSGGGYLTATVGKRTAQEWNALTSLLPSAIQGGGGGGQGRFTSGADPGGIGGSGGLAVFVASPLITGSGSIVSDGERGSPYRGTAPAYTATAFGGGGANGGPLLMISESNTVSTSSAAGVGGAGTTTSGSGGHGSGFVGKYKPSTDAYS